MKTGVSYWMFEGGLEAEKPIAEAMQEAKELGFEAIELAVASKGVLTHRSTQRACEDVVALAEEVGVEVCVENVWNKFLLSPLEMRDFVDSFDSERIGAYFDVGNVLLTGYPEHWIRILGRRIKRVHIKDFRRSIGTVEGFVDLLEGDVDFQAVKEALADIGYDGYVTVELLPFEPGRLERTAQALKEVFK